MRALPVLILPLAILAASCAETAAGDGVTARSDGRQCFLPRQVNGFNAEGDDRVFVTVGTRDVYELRIVGICPDIDWSQRIGIRSRGSSWICDSLDAELIVPSPSGTQFCPVTGVRRLSEAEVRAYRERRRDEASVRRVRKTTRPRCGTTMPLSGWLG